MINAVISSFSSSCSQSKIISPCYIPISWRSQRELGEGR